MTFARWSQSAAFICIIAVSHSLEYSKLISETTQAKKPEETKPGSLEAVGAHEEKEAPLHEVMVRHPVQRPPPLWAQPEEDSESVMPRARILRPRRVHPGQYADKRKNKNWKLWPEYLKSGVSPSDSKIAWSYWEADESEGWEEDAADDSKPSTKTPTTTTSTTTTTTTTTTTPAPTTTMKAAKEKPPVSIHKHFHYFKKAAPWKGDKGMPTTTMPMPMHMEESMKMSDDMMMDMMMKAMMMMPPEPEKKGGLTGILNKLAQVDPITVLVAGIIPASLILAAALPSVMHKMMAMKGDTPAMIPMITTTAVGGGPEAPASRSQRDSMSSIIEAIGDFGMKALEKPHCARKMFCELAVDNIVADSPVVQKAVHLASLAMEDSWLEHLGVRGIINSLNEGTCNKVDCDKEPENFIDT